MSKAPETLTLDGSEALLKELRCETASGWSAWRNLRNYTMALLMLDAGLRVGEVCRLNIADLIITDQPVHSLNVHGGIAEKRCTRIVPLTPRVIEALKKMQEIVWSALAEEYRGVAFFAQDTITPLTVRQVQRIIGSASLRSIHRYIHPHVLRHTFATRLMRVTSIPVVQQLLGHKHQSSTQVYTHPNSDDSVAAIKALEKNAKQTP